MTQAERSEIRRVTAQVMAGDRSGALAMLRALGAPPRLQRDAEGQFVFAFLLFRCETLGVDGMPTHVCVTRQMATDAQRTNQVTRGQGTDHPSCDSRKCAQGRRIREALDPHARVTWLGAGPGGRFARERTMVDEDAEEAG